MKKNYLFTLIFTLLFSFSYSATYYVATAANGGSNGNTGTEASPWLTLTYAVSQASSGDTIIIGPGTFSNDSEIYVEIALTIEGHGRDETIFDGSTSNTNEGFLILNATNGNQVTVKNMTIRDYHITSGGLQYGGTAIRIGRPRGNSSTSWEGRDVDLINIKFYNNKYDDTGETSDDGGAVYVMPTTSNVNHDINIRECLFYDNSSDYRGGAIFAEDGTNMNIYNSVFVDNASDWGGAIYFRDELTDGIDSNYNLYNCTLYRNFGRVSSTSQSGNIYAYSGYDDIDVNIYNSIIMYAQVGSTGSYGYDLRSGSESRVNWSLNYTYTRSVYSYYMDSWDSFSQTNEYEVGGSWPGHDGSDKNMNFDVDDNNYNGVFDSGDVIAANSHAIGKVVSNGTSIDVNGVTRPQGSASDIGAYEYRNTWDGSESSDWATAANWSLNTVPSSTSAYNSPKIPVSGSVEIDYSTISNYPVISTDIEIENLEIDNGASVTISNTGSLKLTKHLINNGTLTMQSDSQNFSSLIVEGNSYGETKHWYDSANYGDNGFNSGNITYQRYVADEGTNEWDFIGSPVEGQDLQSLIDNNSSLATNSSSVAIGPYDNSASNGDADTSNFYTYYNTTGNSGTTLPIGKGYVMATDEGSTDATVNFTGPVVTENIYYAITNATSSNTNYGKFNLVANPYPSFINANSNTGGTNFITVNSDAGNLLSGFVYVYGYDGDGTFTYYNNTSLALRIAPGQGFFVASKVGGASLKFTKAMQTNTGGDDFISGDVMENTEVVIKLFNDDNELDSTKLFFEEGLSLGLDDGYDAGSFDQNSPIMTRLIEDDEGYGMAINAMGLDAMENAVIPLVINQSAGQEFRINLFTATIPDPNVYLEDVEEGTFTNLYEEDFVYTPTSDLEGVGRFFIHMSADTMSSGEVSTSMLNAYKEIDASYITIEGLATQTNETNVSLYNILGRKVLSTTLNNNMSTQTISTVGLSAGIYVIELESGTDRLTKKLLIQ